VRPALQAKHGSSLRRDHAPRRTAYPCPGLTRHRRLRPASRSRLASRCPKIRDQRSDVRRLRARHQPPPLKRRHQPPHTIQMTASRCQTSTDAREPQDLRPERLRLLTSEL
jgi:hypothetical protein